ncbi:transposase domain-containing protein [Streptomyces hoynatensis]|uniref:IS4 family transposase n=1 Tax=Streptomyces hoynatensis TaxID=1141874 RepID=A0A3A9YTW0_9ACTN|nr:transposase domain-containing protein [Streptomyces hoynatensis]RKN39511.1 IS4 family transposase [Streptomyces hoynatensis]
MDLIAESLSDRLAVGLLTRVYPPHLVEHAVRESGRAGQRNRLLPPGKTVYFVLAMCLFSGAPYEQVAGVLSDGLAWVEPNLLNFAAGRPGQIPSTAAISRARRRLGSDPLKALFRTVTSEQEALYSAQGTRYGRWWLKSLDGGTTAVSPSKENLEWFGYAPGGAPGHVRVSALAQCGTGLLRDVEVRADLGGEPPASPAMLAKTGPGDLVLADGPYASAEAWATASATGAQLLWGRPADARLLPLRRLADGSMLHVFEPPRGEATTVRLLDGPPGGGQLMTTLLDPHVAPAPDLRSVHASRWRFGVALEELRTQRPGPSMDLRSRSPEMVEQEVWGHVLVYCAIRSVMNWKHSVL